LFKNGQTIEEYLMIYQLELTDLGKKWYFGTDKEVKVQHQVSAEKEEKARGMVAHYEICEFNRQFWLDNGYSTCIGRGE